ncbi:MULTISPECIES: hypothetical protein [unclassified Halanaerobium]|uniref:hypothetical protein n=1 Tax=unclassified Halanaerobium TaxID=2641197 RepID=UPI000DF3BF3F|nr:MULTISPECIES: hypothetical protein [unclassified Halanaerobium]RCW50529.1 hypothetical protein DFR78_103114 [Halanaerobium sp. MA284_MarDTE_T2]RCW86012.1 hypothetical protein DER71_10977 [Halanaerobium sp. DL-01]
MVVLLKSREISYHDIITKVVVLLLVILTAAVFIFNYIIANRVDNLKNQISHVSTLKNKYSYMLKNNKKTSIKKGEALDKSDIIESIINIPEKMSFDYLLVDSKLIEIQGKTVNRMEILNYTKQLKSNTMIKSVKLKKINKYTSYQFTLEAALNERK